MDGEKASSREEIELKAAIEKVLKSPSRKKLVLAGPGTGKTYLFKLLLESIAGDPNRRIVLTFLNNLRDDLEEHLSGLANVYTLHSYCLGLLYKNPKIGIGLSSNFNCFPGLASIIANDWELIKDEESPKFVNEMRTLSDNINIQFYINRSSYYDAVDFDDSVFRVYKGFSSGLVVPNKYDLILVDEYQDFNKLEAGLINELSKNNSILIAGDDDQALYSQLRSASWEHIRLLNNSDEYDIFELPFCMRCPKVVVEAVNDVIIEAKKIQKLNGRISKPYKYYPPVKGADSEKYPKIFNVETSVQRENANYIGRYIGTEIIKISQDDIQKAKKDGFPATLVIASNPYRDQIYNHLKKIGLPVEERIDSSDKLSREEGLRILSKDKESNLGWRIILKTDSPKFIKEVINKTNDCSVPIVKYLPDEFVNNVLSDLKDFEKSEENNKDNKVNSKDVNEQNIKITSFEGAKGLSAQHVFVAGMHNNELPHDENNTKDLEICKFLVGLTRTRKSCTLIYTKNFAGNWKKPSVLLSWVNPERFKNIKVNVSYWK